MKRCFINIFQSLLKKIYSTLQAQLLGISNIEQRYSYTLKACG